MRGAGDISDLVRGMCGAGWIGQQGMLAFICRGGRFVQVLGSEERVPWCCLQLFSWTCMV